MKEEQKTDTTEAVDTVKVAEVAVPVDLLLALATVTNVLILRYGEEKATKALSACLIALGNSDAVLVSKALTDFTRKIKLTE